MSDEDIVTTLAYTKSPKFSKRTTFQEELKEALFARTARQNSIEYPDDFESDEEGTIEELPEDVERRPKNSVTFAIPLSSYNLGSVGTLQSRSAKDLDSSRHDDRAQPGSVLESEISSEQGQAVPSSLTENSESSQGSASTKASISCEASPPGDCSWKRETVDNLALFEDEVIIQATCLPERKLGEESPRDDPEFPVSEEEQNVERDQDQQYEAPMTEQLVERNDVMPHKPDIKPVPRPREFKTKTALASAENISIPALDDYSKPSPQPRGVLRKSCRVEDYEGSRAEDKASHSHRAFSLSAPPSLTRLNDQVRPSEQRALSESPAPEGPWIASSSSPFPINFSSLNERTGDAKLIMSEEDPSKDQVQKETDNCSDLKLQESGRESPSVIELMMTTVYEKAKKSVEGGPEGKLQTSEYAAAAAAEDGSDETTKKDKSEKKKALSNSKVVPNVSKESVKKEEVEEKVRAAQKTRPPTGRSLSSTYLKKTGKPSAIPISTSSQYLGTLKVLDNKHLQKYSAELDKADSLRAAVYQDWLEKKRIFLLELQRIKRNKAENLKDKNEKEQAAKKEEATASFEAWKAMKEKEAKKLAEKKRLEEEKKKKEAEQNEKKREEALKAAFEKWKEKKAEYLKEQIRREKRVERLKKKKEEEAVAEKKKDSSSAVEKWNEKKEDFLKQKKKEKKQERKKEVEEQFEKEEKDKNAIEEYEKWLEKTELKGRIQKKQKKLKVILEDEMPPPWSPPGKAVTSRSY